MSAEKDFLVVWLDLNSDEHNVDIQYSVSQLQKIVNSVIRFADRDQCIDYLTDIKNEKVFMILFGSLDEQFVSLIVDVPQLYAFYSYTPEHERWTKDYRKLKGVFSEMKSLCQRLSKDIFMAKIDWISISVVPKSSSSSIDFNQLDQSFMYSQLLKEILLKMEYSEQAKDEFVEFCLEQYIENESTIEVIGEFERDYGQSQSSSSIWWYTRDCFIYPMLNKALRTQNIDIILKMGFFLRDLHQQIEHLHLNIDKSSTIIVYRGQGILNAEFPKIMRNEGGLLSFNNFLSTTRDEQIAHMRADSSRDDPELTGILFEIIIDPSISTTPFARLNTVSYFRDLEEEILFSMHTVFRIIQVEQIDDRRLWRVKLTLTSENDEQLKCLTDYIRNEIEWQPEWAKLAFLTYTMGEFNKAEEIHKKSLDSTTDIDSIDNALLHVRLGAIMSAKGEQNIALSHLTKALEIFQKHFPLDHPCTIAIEAAIGGVLRLQGDYSTALAKMKKGIEISEQLFPSDDPTQAEAHNNIAAAYQSMGDYRTALFHLEKTLEIQQKVLPLTHPNLGATHSNIGDVFRAMGSYSDACLHFKKALEILQKSLPSNHPNLGLINSNIGETLRAMGEYPAALSYLSKALEIQQQSIQSNDFDRDILYNNIASVYQSLGEHSIALSYLEKALQVQQELLPHNHSNIALTHNNIGEAYRLMGSNSIARSHYQKALEIWQQSLPPDHPDLATLHNNIGMSYYLEQQYAIALRHYEKALEIQEKSLPFHHSDLAMTHNNIGLILRSMGQYSKALEHIEKALKINENAFGPNHPDMAMVHNSLGMLYYSMKQYSNALSSLEKALKIFQQSFSSNPKTLAMLHNNIGFVCEAMCTYSIALSHYQKAVEILETSPIYYSSDLDRIRKNIRVLCEKMQSC